MRSLAPYLYDCRYSPWSCRSPRPFVTDLCPALLLYPRSPAPCTRRFQRAKRALLLPTAARVTVLLFLLPLLSAGQSIPEQEAAERLSNAFPRRLEATFKYQQAILPVGIVNRESYLKVGQRQYLLAETVRLPRDKQIQQDTYVVQSLNGGLRTSFQSRYLVEPSPGMSSPGQRVSYYQAYVLTDQGLQQTKALLLRNFDPQDLLAEQPATGKSAFFYVLDNVSAGRGDTLASYHLECPANSPSCVLTLEERLDDRTRRWHTNHGSTQTWTSTWQGPRQELLISERPGQGFRWTRRYHTAHEFTETLEESNLAPGVGGGASWRMTVYERHYCRQDEQRAVDTYTLSGYPTVGAPLKPLKLSVVHVDM
jgi:hypothetical protein